MDEKVDKLKRLSYIDIINGSLFKNVSLFRNSSRGQTLCMVAQFAQLEHKDSQNKGQANQALYILTYSEQKSGRKPVHKGQPKKRRKYAPGPAVMC